MVYISPSSLNNYKQCPYKYYWANVLKNKEVQSIDAIFGQAVHGAMQTHAQKIITNEGEKFREDIKKLLLQENIPPVLMADSKMLQKWIKVFNDVYDNYDKIFSSTTFALENFIDKIYINDNTCATGKYDRLDWEKDESLITCVDYKTGKVDEKSLDLDFQYLIYSKYLINKFQNEKKKEIRWIAFKDGYKSVKKDASTANWQYVLDWVEKIAGEKNYDPCDGVLCDWCGAKEFCPLFSKVDVRQGRITKQSSIEPVVAPIQQTEEIKKPSRFKLKQKVETDACPGCNKQIPIDSVKCPECGVEFETNTEGNK